MIKILCDSENNVISKGYANYISKNGEKIFEIDDKDNDLISKRSDELIFNSDKKILELKKDIQVKKEKFKKIQNELLHNPLLKELRNAMTFQVIAKGKGSNSENEIFTDDQIKQWGNYFGAIAKNGQDLSGLKLDEITPAIFGKMPSLPEAYQNIL
jgi:hypothetical protein